MSNPNHFRKYKSTHKIKTISYALNKIECVCEEWVGEIEDYRAHQDNSPPTDKKVDKYFLATFQVGSRPSMREKAKAG